MCAIFGIARNPEAANFTYLGLHALQHRGQEGAGIAANDDGKPHVHRRLGLVGKIFQQDVLRNLKGSTSIGHTRYSTTGGNIAANLQPMMMKSSLGWVSIVHNGNIVNSAELIHRLEKEGSIFQSTNDTEVIFHLMARSGKSNFKNALIESLRQVEGAYSILVMNENKLVAVRDPFGWRPLVMGNLAGSPVFASETSALELIGAEYVREVEPGEMISVDITNQSEIQSEFPFEKKARKACVFEHIYFARPDSSVFGRNVHEVRKGLGKRLAQEQPVPEADLVIPVPDSGVPAAIGFAEASGVPFDLAIIRSHYVGRTFIEPTQSIRHLGVKLKLSAVRETIEGKSVVVVDDSLVRGTTSKKLIQTLKEAGAKEVHVRISAPPTAYPCFYGIDTPTREELMASTHSVDEIREYIDADSLGYISLEGLIETASKTAGDGFCHACFSGEYPTPVPH